MIPMVKDDTSYYGTNFDLNWSFQLISTAETVFIARIHNVFSLTTGEILNWEA